jgi:HNH endonuclease
MSSPVIWESQELKRLWEEKISQKAVDFFEKFVISQQSLKFKSIKQYAEETNIPLKYIRRSSDVFHELGLMEKKVNGDEMSCTFELPIRFNPPKNAKRESWGTDKRKSQYISQKIRKEIYTLDDGICAYCGALIDFKESRVDHIYPDSKGGADDIDNMTISCEKCNRKKWYWIPGDSEFLEPQHFRGKRVKNVTYEKRDGGYYPKFTF